MVQISGKYKLVETKNLYELFLALGIPAEAAKKRSESKWNLEVTLDGKNFTLTIDDPPIVTKLVLGQEVEEKIPGNAVILSTASLDGNVVTVIAKTKDGVPAGTRTYKFSDSGIETTTNATKDGKTITASGIYKRI